MTVFATLATFYRQGGMFMHAVLVIGVTIIAIVVERMIVVSKAAAIDGRKFTDDLVQFANRGDVTGARRIAMTGRTPIARVAQAMLESAPAEEETLQTAADDAAALALPELTRRLSFLGVLANSATLIGLLGTITGLITAISGVGVADAAQRSATLSSGISEALHTTAFGLIVAIPTLLVQGWLNGRIEGVSESLESLTIRLSKALARSAGSHASPVSMARAAGAPGAVALPRATNVPQAGSH